MDQKPVAASKCSCSSNWGPFLVSVTVQLVCILE